MLSWLSTSLERRLRRVRFVGLAGCFKGAPRDLARSQTYTYAVLNMRHGGASAGISAEGPKRSEAIAAFVAEAAELVEYGTYLPDAAKGVGEADLAPLRGNDPRDTTRLSGNGSNFADQCEGLSAAVCAQHSVGDLSGRSVSIEGFNANGPALAAAVIERGATVTAVATSVGTVSSSSGFDARTLADTWAAHGAGLVNELGAVGGPADVFASGADVFFVGSKMGAVNHEIAAQIQDTAAVVACGRIPVTARALAVFAARRCGGSRGFCRSRRFGPCPLGGPGPFRCRVLDAVAETVGVLSSEFAVHSDGPFLAACRAAESYLLTWQDELPFGRPLAP